MIDKLFQLHQRYAAGLWLGLGTALFAFATVQRTVPAAAWLAPIFLLRFSRTSPGKLGLPLLALALAGSASAALTGYLDPPPPAWLFAGLAVSYAAIYTLPYAADRLIGPRLGGAARTLVFPAAATTLDWLMQWHPFPSFGSPAYTQFGNLPLMQLASLTGIWGITFLVTWGAAAVNAAWEGGWTRRALLAHGAPFALALAAALLYGGVRLAAPAAGPTAQVAALTPSRELWRYPPVREIAGATREARAAFGAEAAQVVDDLFERTAAAAAAGAEIVVWAETAAFVPEEDAATVLERAAGLARREGIYLQIGLGSIGRGEHHPFAENRAVLFGPAGELLWDYHKAHLVPIGDAAEMAPGPASVPTVDTPHGRLATVICFDGSFVGYTRQAGLAGTDILFAPADDWYQNRYDHANMHVFRAIENGVALVRPGAKGITYITDRLGRVLAQSDYFAASPAAITLIAVPTAGVPTLYTLIGDSFAYAVAAGLALLALLALARRGAPAVVARPV